MKLLTDRLLLRPFEATDLPHLQRYAVRPEFYRFLPILEQTPETVAAFLEKRLEEQRQEESSRFNFAIEPKELKFVIGSIRIEVRDAANRKGDLGYALDSAYQGQGFMIEAVKRVLTMGFDRLKLHRILATADVDNEPSWRLLERVGMTREGHLRGDKLVRGRWRDSYLYAVLASDTGRVESVDEA